jgi:hypothetical protein
MTSFEPDVKVCPHRRVMVAPAAMLQTLVETVSRVLGDPLQVIDAEVTSIMGPSYEGRRRQL